LTRTQKKDELEDERLCLKRGQGAWLIPAQDDQKENFNV